MLDTKTTMVLLGCYSLSKLTLEKKNPEEESIVMQFPLYILQSELSFLDNLVDKGF